MLPPRQKEVLETIIHETETLCPPTLKRLVESLEVSYSIVRAAMSGLEKKGYVKQVYAAGPYMALKNTNGDDLEWTFTKKAA